MVCISVFLNLFPGPNLLLQNRIKVICHAINVCLKTLNFSDKFKTVHIFIFDVYVEHTDQLSSTENVIKPKYSFFINFHHLSFEYFQ